LYLGAWYPAGYYYPGYWYLGDWYAYEFYIDDQLRFSGLKIELGAIQESERDAVKQGVVYVDGIEMGTVKQFTGIWHEPLPLAPGSHEVVVRLADGRELATTLGIVPGHVTRLLLRFNKPAPKPNPNLDLGPSYE